MLQKDSIKFSVKCVQGRSELEETLNDKSNIEYLRNIILINCGAYLDLTEYWFCKEEGYNSKKIPLKIKENIRTFVFDNHMPIAHNNVIYNKNIQIFAEPKLSKIDECPNQEDIDYVFQYD